MSNLRTCRKCGWVSFPVTRAHAELEVKQFNEYFDTLSKEEQELFGGHKSSIERYERCFLCNGSHTNFKVSEANDCPPGCTLNPIIHEPKSE